MLAISDKTPSGDMSSPGTRMIRSAHVSVLSALLFAGCADTRTHGRLLQDRADVAARSSLQSELEEKLHQHMGISDYDSDNYHHGTRDHDDDDMTGLKDRDGDRDGNSAYSDPDEKGIGIPDRAAGTADAREIEALIKRYFEAALAGDGGTICALLLPDIANKVASDPALPPYARAGSCVAAMSKLFGDNHFQMAIEARALEAVHPRVQGNQGWALLAFRRISTRGIAVQRQGGAWKLATTIDQEVP